MSTDTTYKFLGVDDSNGRLLVTRGLLTGEDLSSDLWTDAPSGRKVSPHAPSMKMLSRFTVKKLVAEAKIWGLETKGKKQAGFCYMHDPSCMRTNPNLDASYLSRLEQCTPLTESSRYLRNAWLRLSMPRECTSKL